MIFRQCVTGIHLCKIIIDAYTRQYNDQRRGQHSNKSFFLCYKFFPDKMKQETNNSNQCSNGSDMIKRTENAAERIFIIHLLKRFIAFEVCIIAYQMGKLF